MKKTGYVLLALASGAMLLLSPTPRMAFNNAVSLFVLVCILRFIIKLIRVFWIPLLVLAGLYYLCVC